MSAVTINGMRGLGDNIYQRAFVKASPHSVTIATPWPELYSDIDGIRFSRIETTLRTQLKNIVKQNADVWSSGSGQQISAHYGNKPVMEGLQDCFGHSPAALDLPDYGAPVVDGRYVLIRPVTVRKEWPAVSRNPLAEYVYEASAIMRDMGFTVVSVADLEDGQEWALEPMPYADIQYHAGELDVKQLMALTQGAAAVVGGIGWIVPAAIAAKVPAYFIGGGHGSFNAPEILTSAAMDLSRIRFELPDNFCMCTARDHACDKVITGFEQKFSQWFKSTVDLAA
jgi:hypothetical protein